ncbi:hypothetical protein NMD88_03675 [Edwardsiella tarda]|uniref:hypothetical protein n=1 Tax=Edwardsiella tarda TaxID=636 RepID=UPI00351C21A9
MKERPIIFNDEMVRAILSGTKTMTRRTMKVQPESPNFGLSFITESKRKSDEGKYFWSISDACGLKMRSNPFPCPFGAVGDRLWVRETFSTLGNEDGCPIDWNGHLVKEGGPDAARIYRASCEQKPGNYGLWSMPDDAFWKPHTDDMQYEGSWTPSIHMPRWASRITLEITDVRVELLQDITEEDARAEGVINGGCLSCGEPEPCGCDAPDPSAIEGFAHLWRDIYGDDGWNSNPWVWVIAFRCVATGIAAGASKGA